MRVISQNGMIDVPYEMTAFHMAGGTIRMNMVGDTGKGTIIAQYSTQDKAEKAMQKLRECYLGIHVVEKLNDTVDCSSLSQIGIYKKNENGDYAYKLPAGEKIFRFPQDDEL